MNGYLKQSTAAQVRTIGPFIDDTDFKTLENALTIANTDIIIKKNGAASVTKNSGGATADGSAGLYHLTWDATDTNTVGELYGSVKVAGALVVFFSYVVLEEAVYDALFAAAAPGYLQPTVAARTLNVSAGGVADADAVAISTDTAAADRLETMLDGTGGNTLSLGQLNIVSSAGAAIVATGGAGGHGVEIAATAAGFNGLQCTGNGAGQGLRAIGGATGHGAEFSGNGGSVGFQCAGNGGGAGITAVGGATGNGITAQGGATSGHGINGVAQGGGSSGLRGVVTGGGGNGITGVAEGAGAGISATGGATGHGINALGGATSGDGLHAEAQTVGDGIEGVGAGGGRDLNVDQLPAALVGGRMDSNVGSWVGVVPNALIAGRVDANAQVVGDKTGYSIGVGGITNLSFAANAIDAAALDATAGQEIADEILNRNLAGGGSGSSRNVRNALRTARNRVVITGGGAMTVYEEDDTTTAWTAVATRTAGTNPIVEVDPA